MNFIHYIIGTLDGLMGNNLITDWIQAISAITVAICSILLVLLGFISLPNIRKQVNNISNKLFQVKFDFCKNCPFASVCVSPYLEETGDFNRKNLIENQVMADELVDLFNEIKNYNFNKLKYTGSKEHKECLLKKLTIAINLIGGVYGSFNRQKDNDIIEKNKR